MTVAYELDFETYRPQLYVVPDQAARTAPTPQVRRRRVVVGAVLVILLVLLALPIRALGGSTLAQAAPARSPGRSVTPSTASSTSRCRRAGPAR